MSERRGDGGQRIAAKSKGVLWVHLGVDSVDSRIFGIFIVTSVHLIRNLGLKKKRNDNLSVIDLFIYLLYVF